MKQTVDWHSYWTRESPGFHEGRVNSYLQQYLPLFDLSPTDRIFVPLCGKAVDMLWLSQQGFDVIGVELSEVAIKSFFRESGLTFETTRNDRFVIYRSANITLYQGDLMDLLPEHLACCRLIYDRASLVAIEPFNRPSYRDHLLAICPDNTPMLLISLAYDQQVMQGPPFSVPEDEVRALYHSRYDIELLQVSEQIGERPRWREIGLESLLESALRLTAR